MQLFYLKNTSIDQNNKLFLKNTSIDQNNILVTMSKSKIAYILGRREYIRQVIKGCHYHEQ